MWTYNGKIAQAIGINSSSDSNGATAISISDVTTLPSEVKSPQNLLTPRRRFVDGAAGASNNSASNASITSAFVIQAGDVGNGQTVQFDLNMSENVTVTGAGPTLRLNDGGVATYDAADSTGTELAFDYNVGSSAKPSNLEITKVTSTKSVHAPGGASIDFSVLDKRPTNLSINSPLAVKSVDEFEDRRGRRGQARALDITMNQAVKVDTAGGAPTLGLNDGGTATYDAAASKPSAGKLVFDYTVGSDDETANLAIDSVDLPTGTSVNDSAGYNADFSAADDAPTGPSGRPRPTSPRSRPRTAARSGRARPSV